MTAGADFEAIRPEAGPCLADYNNQIETATGLRFPFDINPVQQPFFITHTLPNHIQQPEAIGDNLITFMRLARRIEAFGPFAVHATIWTPENALTETSLQIPKKTVDAYQQFGAAAQTYYKALRGSDTSRPPSDTLTDAALDLCKLSRPNEWDPAADDPNFDIETQVRPAGFYTNSLQQQIVPDYLNAVIDGARPVSAAS